MSADRARAHDWVASTRRRWQGLLDRLADGTITLDRLWLEADRDPAAAELKLLVALEARPGAKKVLTRRALDALGLPQSITLGELDDRLRRRLEAVFADPAAPDATALPDSAGIDATQPDQPGLIIVISGPGGVGKGTVVHRLLERDPRLWLSRSWTTRAPRPGEAEDAYRWATTEEFVAHADSGGFLEWVEFLDYCQGSPVPDPPPGCDVVFEIDVAGATALRERWDDALCVFIDTPSRVEQEARLRGRGDDPERIAQRLIKADEEVAAALAMDAIVVINDDVEATVDELQALIESARRARRSPGGPAPA